MAGWRVWSARVADQVTVRWASSPQCRGTTVADRPSAGADDTDPDTVMRDVVEVRPTMHCRVMIELRNDSGRAVTLRGVEAMWLGSGSRVLVRAETGALMGLTDAPRDAGDDRAALFGWSRGETLAAHSSLVVPIAFAHRPDGCSGAGTFSADDWPTLRFRALGVDHETSAADTLHLAAARQMGSCRE